MKKNLKINFVTLKTADIELLLVKIMVFAKVQHHFTFSVVSTLDPSYRIGAAYPVIVSHHKLQTDPLCVQREVECVFDTEVHKQPGRQGKRKKNTN